MYVKLKTTLPTNPELSGQSLVAHAQKDIPSTAVGENGFTHVRTAGKIFNAFYDLKITKTSFLPCEPMGTLIRGSSVQDGVKALMGYHNVHETLGLDSIVANQQATSRAPDLSRSVS